jgi:nucleotide-binding universal stress UspA family protein
MVVATDGSDTAKQVVREAGHLAQSVGARVHVVTAYTPVRSARVAGGRAANPESWHVPADSRADAILDDACAELRLAGVEAETHARTGNPADVILDVAEEIGADLVVVGSKGLGDARRHLLGNVPNKVSHHANCSVLIVHTG